MASNDLYNHRALLTTHALDIASGRPASGLTLDLARRHKGVTEVITQRCLNRDGRSDAPLLLQDGSNGVVGDYILTFDAANYHCMPTIFDRVLIDFHIADPSGHYHVPLILAPGGYATYRGVPPACQPRDYGSWQLACDVAEVPPTVSQATAGGAGLSLHVMDTACGRGAGGLVGSLITPDNGRLAVNINIEGRTNHWLIADGGLQQGHYELTLNSGDYYRNRGFGVGARPFVTRIRVQLDVQQVREHHHLVLILSPWGYSCYRGS